MNIQINQDKVTLELSTGQTLALMYCLTRANVKAELALFKEELSEMIYNLDLNREDWEKEKEIYKH